MQDLLTQVRQAAAAGLYYAALFPALALPDICGALESCDGEATGAKYKTWFDRWVAPKYDGFLDGEDCYWFRCSLLHQGSTQHKKSSYSRVLFLEPGTSTHLWHRNTFNDALNIDVNIFCEDMCASVEAWLPSASALPQYATNKARFITRHPMGIPGYVEGIPIIG